MEGVVEHDHGRAAGGDARDLDGVLDRLGAAVQEQRLLVGAAAGRELGEPPAHLDVRLVHADHEALVHVAVDLRVHRIDDGGQVVAEVGAAEPAGEVDVLAPLGVPDARALGALDDEGRGRDPARDIALAGFLDALGCASFLQRHGNRDCICVIHPAKVRTGTGPADTIPPPGALAEWLGSGLQSRLQQFESARRLSLAPRRRVNCRRRRWRVPRGVRERPRTASDHASKRRTPGPLDRRRVGCRGDGGDPPITRVRASAGAAAEDAFDACKRAALRAGVPVRRIEIAPAAGGTRSRSLRARVR